MNRAEREALREKQIIWLQQGLNRMRADDPHRARVRQAIANIRAATERERAR